MTRFRPSVEPLDARDLPSAVFDPVADATGDVDAATTATADPGETVVAKVKLSDIHFTSTVSKPSP